MFFFCPKFFSFSLLPPPKPAVFKLGAVGTTHSEGEGNTAEGGCFASIFIIKAKLIAVMNEIIVLYGLHKYVNCTQVNRPLIFELIRHFENI